jgi:yeast amino acid transporter
MSPYNDKMSSTYPEKGPATSENSNPSLEPNDNTAMGSISTITAGSQALHRKLRGKEVQLFAIGGAIGTCKLTHHLDIIRRGTEGKD